MENKVVTLTYSALLFDGSENFKDIEMVNPSLRQVKEEGYVGLSQSNNANALDNIDPDVNALLNKATTPNMWSWSYIGLCKENMVSFFLSY